MFKVYAENDVNEVIEKTVSTLEEAKNILLEWDENLDEDWMEMWVINLETGEELGWLEVVE